MIFVASYCRVSTEKDDQTNSFESQQRYFRAYIERQPDWELYRVYADEGITGTCTQKRVQFNQMIHDARMGKFKLIITKEVSRFSRNILDTIRFTRELKAHGVGVLFMNDGCDRRLETLRTALLAAREQEQLRCEISMLLSDVKTHIGDLAGRERDKRFWGDVLDTLTVYPDRHVVVRLNLLPEKWRFVLDSMADIRRRTQGVGCQIDPAVPISVSRPFRSSKGME